MPAPRPPSAPVSSKRPMPPPRKGVAPRGKKGATVASPTPAADRDWESQLRDTFSADLVRKVRAYWEKADADHNNALARDELQCFMEDLYDATGTPLPPYSVLRQEIVELFRRYDIDRNMLIEVDEMCYYLKGSHFARTLAVKHRAKGKDRPHSAQAGAGEPGGIDHRKRRRSKALPWFQQDMCISDKTIPLLHPATFAAIDAAVQPRKRVCQNPSPVCAWTCAEDASVAVLADKWLCMAEAKEDSVLDEMAFGLKAPVHNASAGRGGGAQCYAQLFALSEELAKRHSALLTEWPRVGLVVATLAAASAIDLDRMLGWDDVPPVGAPPEEIAAYAPRNERFSDVLAQSATDDDQLQDWIKTQLLLLQLSKPLPADLKGKEHALAAVPADSSITAAQKDAVGVWTAPGISCAADGMATGGDIILRMNSIDSCIDLRPFGCSGVMVPPLQTVKVHSAGAKGVWVVSTEKADPALVQLRKCSQVGVEFADKQLDMVRGVLHEKRVGFLCACFTHIFNPSGSGKCSKDDIIRGFKRIDEPLIDEDVDDVFRYADADKDGFVDSVEFVTAVMRAAPQPKKPKSKKAGGKQAADPDHSRALEVHKIWQVLRAALHDNLDRHMTSIKARRPDRYLPSSLRAPKKTRERTLNTVPMEWEEGDVLNIGAGEYKGNVTLEANMIVMRGPRDGRAVLIAGGKAGQATLTVTGKRVVLERIDIVNTGEGHAVLVKGGYHDFIDCTFKSQKDGVLCEAGSNVHFKECKVTEVRSGWGMCLRGRAQTETAGIIEGCKFSGCQDGGLVVEQHARPWVGQCTFMSGRGCGVVYCGGGGVLVGCEIAKNACSGIFIEAAGSPIVFRNRVHSNAASGIKVTGGAKGLLEQNDIYGNADNEIESTKMAEPIVRGNIIHDGKTSGVLIHDLGRGFFFENEVRSYPVAGITMGPKSQATVKGNSVWYDSDQCAGGHAVALRAGALGVVAENMFVGWDGARGAAMKAAMDQRRGSSEARTGPPPAFDVSGDHDCTLDGNWTAPTMDEAKADRRRWLFDRFGTPQ
eukprot:TRINITY_DN3337_c0_g1_i1.p1 TRINITY_DN3337_c0_g1~~TRINITY_DN3337_c0_g1_i1.p1  ORF type:complete len:1054 (+),score=113.54 TRINITY_DN3337_c0_g1_i1:39-3164(+)